MAWPTVAIDTVDMDAGTDSPATARAQIKQMADNLNAIKDAKGAASGVAPLDSSSLLPTANLPIAPATKGGTGQSLYTIGDVLYADTTSTLAKLSAGSAGYALASNGPGAAPSYQQVGGFPAGTRMSFQQTAAPTGWTKDTTAAINDSIMRLNTGTVGSGGSVAFSTWSTTTPTIGATTLSISQLPEHEHWINWQNGNGSGAYSTINTTVLASTNRATKPTAQVLAYLNGTGGSSHTHSGPAAPSVKYYDFIIASKN